MTADAIPFGPPPPPPPAGYGANVVVVLDAAGGLAREVLWNGPALVEVFYADGAIDTFVNQQAAGQVVGETNPDTTPPAGQTKQPGDPQALGPPLAEGPGGIASVAVYLTDAGTLLGMNFNGPAVVTCLWTDGGCCQLQNAAPSGTPAAVLNPSGT